MKYKVEEVFKPGSYPNLTYVSRNSTVTGLTYEDRLKTALKISGFLTYIVGTSKMGKTILCQRVVSEGLVRLTGDDFSLDEDIWTTIASHADMSVEASISTSDNEHLTTSNTYKLNKEGVISYFKNNNKTLLIDDFHYAPDPIRAKIAKQLKDAIGKELRVIVTSLPHYGDELTRKNRDLSGRLSLIAIEPWAINDLKAIASSGFDQLGIKYDDEILDYIASESLSSPQLIQSICLNAADTFEENNEGGSLTREICELAFRKANANFDYHSVVNLLRNGPGVRGTKRTKYLTKSDTAKDLYELILDAMAKDPPITSVTINELRDRILALLAPAQKSKPAKQTITSSLNQMLKLMSDKEEDIFKVFEIRDDCIYITDPQFIFYLRWGENRG